MALPRRSVLGGIAVLLAGCTSRDGAVSTDSPSETPTPTTAPATEPGYVTCDPDRVSTVELHTAGGIPDDLSTARVREYAQSLEEDIVLPPPEERADGYVSFGDVTTETVEYGYLATVEVIGGYQRDEVAGTATGTHADLGQHIATYFVTEQVVRRARDTSTELDPRDHGEIVVCESG
ncbi:MAG: hypothetical protein V5A38_09395 [Halolamina sp.]|uniref:hypothetical protein n=1 Tax=Halolamina sp. TaxID=1940283 RepID=UPI002FC2C9F6